MRTVRNTELLITPKEFERESVFLEIIYDLMMLNDVEKRQIAEIADIHWGTLYSWTSLRTRTPRIDTLCRVARALGYDIVLKRKSTPSPLRPRLVQ